MFIGHNPYLVALSVVIAILGGYTGFGLAARVRGTSGAGRRLLLAGAALFLAVGIWTMHFVGMLAAPLPTDATYLVLPTIVSFLICAIVVGVSLFFVSIGEPSNLRMTASALMLGLGIVSMHYVGIHGLAGPFRVEHQPTMIVIAALIAAGTAYGGLRIFLARHGGMRLALSAVVFGIAVSGMHYTAMYGMRFLPASASHHGDDGLVASPQVLSLIVSLLCFLIVAGFLLFLVPDPRVRPTVSVATSGSGDDFEDMEVAGVIRSGAEAVTLQAQRHLPLRGLGQPRVASAIRLPLEGAGGTRFIEAGQIRSIKADAHYTLVHDGSRERMCPWAISHAEAQLDPAIFIRVHRSHIVSIPHVTLIRKEGDGAVVELDGPAPHLVPVSRSKVAEVRARLGLIRRSA
ncbi:MAG: MHYT domain-containing protein [Pseudaminobacter sp.]